MPIFEKTSRIAALPEVVWAFHEAPGALEALTPPWQPARIVERTPATGIAVGTRVVLATRIGPIPQTMVAEHTAYEPPRMFRDEMRKGPFRRWIHTHRIEPDGQGATLLVDHVDYELPFGLVGRVGGSWFARRQLERLFAYRHRVTRERCEATR